MNNGDNIQEKDLNKNVSDNQQILPDVNEEAEINHDQQKVAYGKEEKQHSKEHRKKKSKTDKEIIEELQNKVNELNDRFLRLYAEFENYRKRALTERLDLIKNASEDIIKLLLPIVDDYERALKSMEADTDIDAMKEGTKLIYNKIKYLLEQKNVQQIKAVGEVFNTDFHEAVTTIPAASDDLKGKVVEEVQKGYTLNGKVIRYAKVVVAN